MMFWWLYVLCLLSVYSGGLTAVLTTERMLLPFTNLEGLSKSVKAGNYKICVENGTALYDAIIDVCI